MSETLVILKPDSIFRNLDKKIIQVILNNGFKIEKFKTIHATDEEILKHYENNLKDANDDIKHRVIQYMTSGQITIMIVSSNNAIDKMRDLIGKSDPEMASKNSIRGLFGSDSYKIALSEKRSCKNLIHASDSFSEFIRERRVWKL